MKTLSKHTCSSLCRHKDKIMHENAWHDHVLEKDRILCVHGISANSLSMAFAQVESVFQSIPFSDSPGGTASVDIIIVGSKVRAMMRCLTGVYEEKPLCRRCGFCGFIWTASLYIDTRIPEDTVLVCSTPKKPWWDGGFSSITLCEE